MPTDIILFLVLSYVIGSVPFGLVLTKMAGLGDIRTIGSGNIGATNVLRTGRKDLALATLLLDAGKGAIVVLVARYLLAYSPEFSAAAGAAAFFGHCFPIFLRFKGGKGVATFFGTLFAINVLIGLLAGVTWLALAFSTRISSVGGLAAAIAAPAATFGLGLQSLAPYLGFMSALIFWRHRENIARLLRGEEPKMGGKKNKAEEAE